MTSIRQLAARAGMGVPPVSVRALLQKFGTRSLRAVEIEQFHNDNLGILVVGTRTGPMTRKADGSFTQPYSFGSIVKPTDAPVQFGGRFSISIEIAGVRCFGTDDPSGTDEPYLITSVYAVDPLERDKSARTETFGPDEFGPISPPKVFGQGRQLLVGDDFKVPGDGSVRIHVALMDKENGDPQEFKDKTAEAARQAVANGLGKIPLLGPGINALVKATGILDAVGDAIGGLVGDIIGDDLIDQHDFVLDSALLLAASRGELTSRKSDSIPGEVYNFPQLKEDDSPEGKSWLFDRGAGKGTYRVFFRVRVDPVAFPPA
jgi:hypothetical protein